jgi:DNA-binding NtrC family response regulator
MSLTLECVPIVEIASPPDGEKCRPVVLVVDDEIAIADTLAIILSKNGFAAIPAYGGKNALEIARVIPPDLLLSDFAMPGMNGVELAIAISQQFADCRVLLFSGHHSVVDILSDARSAGYNFPALTKPIRPDILLAHITRCLEEFKPIFSAADDRLDYSDEGILFPPRAEFNVSSVQLLPLNCARRL